MRQTRLRDEAKARMAAKFGGGGMGGVGSNSRAAPSSGGLRAPSSGGLNMGGMNTQNSSMSAPSSGNLNMSPARPGAAPSSGNVAKMKVASGSDFFANFGS